MEFNHIPKRTKKRTKLGNYVPNPLSEFSDQPFDVYSRTEKYCRGMLVQYGWPDRTFNKYVSKQLISLIASLLILDGEWVFIRKEDLHKLGSTPPKEGYLEMQPGWLGTYYKTPRRVFWFHAGCRPSTDFEPKISYKLDLSEMFPILAVGKVHEKDLSKFEIHDAIRFSPLTYKNPAEKLTYEYLKKIVRPYIQDPLL